MVNVSPLREIEANGWRRIARRASAARGARAPFPLFIPPDNQSESNGFEADRNVPLAKGELPVKLYKAIGTKAGSA